MTHVPTQAELPTENSNSTRKFVFTVLLIFPYAGGTGVNLVNNIGGGGVGGGGAKPTVSIRNFGKQSS
jgi:hypothetical protein